MNYTVLLVLIIMYIKRDVYFSAVDQETGEEKLFSTTEIMTEEAYQKEFGIKETYNKAKQKVSEYAGKASGKIKEGYGKSKDFVVNSAKKPVNATKELGMKMKREGLLKNNEVVRKIGKYVSENPKKVLGGTAAIGTAAVGGIGYAGYKGVKKLTSKKKED